MKSYLISQFIDNELDLDEKIEFVEIVHAHEGYKDEAVDMISKEKLFRMPPVDIIPPVAEPQRPVSVLTRWLRPGLSALACFIFITLVWTHQIQFSQAPQAPISKFHRFVIYQPGMTSVEITGSFTGWQPHTMTPVGSSGYWEAEMELPGGEHKFVYILNRENRIPDPTIPIHEKDDFGGVNSILSISI